LGRDLPSDVSKAGSDWVDVLWKRLDSDLVLHPWGEVVPVTIEEEFGGVTIGLVDVHGTLDAEIVPVEVNASASLAPAPWLWLVVGVFGGLRLDGLVVGVGVVRSGVLRTPVSLMAVITRGSLARKEHHVFLLHHLGVVLILGSIGMGAVAGVVARGVMVRVVRVGVGKDVNVVCAVSAGFFVMFSSWGVGEFFLVVVFGVVISIAVIVVS